MGLLSCILEGICGKARLVIVIANKPAIEILLEGKTIMVDVKNPLLALEFGISEFLDKKKGSKLYSQLLEKLKKLGFRVKVKYKMLELEL